MANLQFKASMISLLRLLRWLPHAAGVVAVLVGGLVLVGWQMDITTFKSVLPGFVSMKANSAVALILAGVSLGLVASKGMRGWGLKWRRGIAGVAAGGVTLLGALTLSQYIGHWDIGIDEMLFWEAWWAAETSHPGRMAPNSALAFLLLGSALLLIEFRPGMAQILTGVAGLIAGLAGIGYLYGVEDLYGLPAYTSTALAEVAAFLVLCVGILATRPDRGWVSILTSDTLGGFAARRLLPLAIAVPIAVGWLLLWGRQAGLHDFAAGLALFAALSIILFTLIIGWSASALRQFDIQRRRAAARLAAEHTVTRILADAPSFEQATPAILKAICESFDAQVGVLWRPDEREQVLTCAETMACSADATAQAFAHATRQVTFSPGQGLPGRAWATNRPVWITNLQADADFPRAGPAAEAELYGGMAFPILIDGACFGVMEFFVARPMEPDQPLRNMMAAIGSEIGQTIERRRTEAAVHTSEARKTAILESAIDCIITMDEHGRIVEFNPAAERTFGHRREDVVGRPLSEVIVPERLRAAHTRGLKHFLESGEGNILGHRVEMPALRADGSEFPVELAITATRLDGGGPFFTGYLRDITDRIQAEAARAESEHRFRGTFENAAVGMAHVDLEGHWMMANQRLCDILGYSREELLGTTLQDISHPDDLHLTEENLRRLRAGDDAPPAIEKRYMRKDGTAVWCSVTASLLRDPETRQPRYIIGAIQDITQRKRVEQQIQRLNETLEQRVAERSAVAEQRANQLRLLTSQLTRAEERERRRLAQLLHDHLQQLLVAAKMRLGMARSEGRDISGGEVGEILRQVDDLLGQSIDASRSLTTELSPPILYEGGLIPALDWLARQMQEKHGLTVEVEIHEAMEVDSEDVRVLLFQAVRELLFNVVKHAGVDRARVRLTRTGDDRVQVMVEDKGPGFDPEAAFTAQSESDDSTGFGLFSVQERLGSLGGTLEIDSHPGEGTRITLTAPHVTAAPAVADSDSVAPPAAEPEHALDRQEDLAGGHGAMRILLADDHKLMRDGIAGLLRAEPDLRVVGEAGNGREALDLARRLRPDVVLMDIAMPRMDGIEATRRITAELREVCVVGLSMHEDEAMAAAMHNAGAIAYLTKGGPAETLIAAIRDCRPPNDDRGVA